jgi:hypothetical protein
LAARVMASPSTTGTFSACAGAHRICPDHVRAQQLVLDRPGRIGIVVLSRTRRSAVCVVEVRGARTGGVNGVAPGGTRNTELRGPASLGLATVRLDDIPNRHATSQRVRR